MSTRGFTLMEVLVVISIIGILVSVILPRLNSARDIAKRANAQLEISALVASMTLLRDDTGFYSNGFDTYCRTSPPSGNEIDLSTANAGLLSNGSGWSGWDGPYVETALDVWGNPYYLDEDYQCLAATTGCNGVTDAGNDSAVVVSCGANGALTNGSCTYDADNIVYRLCDTS